MSPPRRITLLHRLEALGFSGLLAAFRSQPLDRASALGAQLGEAVGPNLSAHRTALRNLALVFPECSQQERAAIAAAMWRQLGRTVAEFAHLDRIQPYRSDGRVRVENVRLLDAIRQSGRGAVFISGHFANWEIMAAALVQRGLACHVTYRPANNPMVDARINAARRSYGVQLQAAKGRQGGLGLLRALAKGETVALMNDQKYAEGVVAPLFGHPAPTADGAARLALRFGAPLVPMSVQRLEGAHFVVRVHEPIALARETPPEEAVLGAVQAINAFVEARVREAPEQWFWVHRRWPKEVWAAAGLMD